jgi:hypothetical protein
MFEALSAAYPTKLHRFSRRESIHTYKIIYAFSVLHIIIYFYSNINNTFGAGKYYNLFFIFSSCIVLLELTVQGNICASFTVTSRHEYWKTEFTRQGRKYDTDNCFATASAIDAAT